MSRVSDSYRARIQDGTFKPLPNESEAIAEGYRAFMDGKSRRSNPHVPYFLATMWRLGWDNAERDNRAARPKKGGGYQKRTKRQAPFYPSTKAAN